tara:strand:- start:9385 stop:16419 length:7035 start_codon:yes stop_codon:yes gene_type:complete
MATIYPMSAGKSLPGSSNSYSDRNSSTLRGVAYKEVSVNPLLKSTDIIAENATSSNAWVASANFFEVRTDAHHTSIANDAADKIGNRILPKNTTLTSYCINRNETSAQKVKLYDSEISSSETNRLFTYHPSSDYPSSDEVGLDVDDYDYFILLNPEIVTAGNDTIRPHFAKITRIVAFDQFGDGLEFTPSYPTAVPKNTKVEIFKGPAKTDTNVVAVSYGLRGDDQSSSPKYDTEHVLSRPTTYFYKDRLDVDGQLDYGMKYTLTNLRWWSATATLNIDEADIHAQWAAGAANKEFTVVHSTDNDKIELGQSIFDHNDNYLGNVESKPTTTTFRLDYARVAINADAVNRTYKIGKSIRNVVFTTETKFGATITNLTETRLDATLVDLNKNVDEDTGTSFNCSRWQNAFSNYYRNNLNHIGATNTAYNDGNLTGPQLYITFEKAQYKNDKIPQVQGVTLNNPRNKISKLARVTSLDTSGLQHLKIKEDTKLLLSNTIYNDSFKKITVVGNVSRDSSTTNLFTLTDISKETDLRHNLTTNSIVEIDGYYYVINTVSAPSGGNQQFTIKNKKLIDANTWDGNTVAPLVDKKTLYLMHFSNGGINLNLKIDTEYEYSTNRMTMNGHRIEKEDTRLNGARLVIGEFNSVKNTVDYGEKDNKFLKMQAPNQIFYQTSTGHISKFHYFGGAYAISDIVFDGQVEDVTSESNGGMTTYKIVGRDQTAKLLSNSINKSLVHTDDIVSTALPPVLDMTDLLANGGSNAVAVATTSNSITWTGTLNIQPKRHGLIFNQDNKLVGEVKSTSGNTTGDGGSNASAIVLFDNAYVSASISSSNQALKYYYPYSLTDSDSTYVNRIAGMKAMASNPLHSDGLTGYTGIVEKGLLFDTGYNITFDGSHSSPTYTNVKIVGTSNLTVYDSWMPSFPVTKTLGYDIASSRGTQLNDGTDGVDSEYLFKLSNENGATLEEKKKMLLNSEVMDVISISEKEESKPTIKVAPRFPVVLGRVNTNTSDSRGNCNFYFVNNNINTGGFIHRLDNSKKKAGAFHSPSETFRYWDLQKFEGGTISKSFNSIYNDGRKAQQIQGYAVGYSITPDGKATASSPTDTPNNRPINGSNTLKGWTYLDTFYGPDADDLILSYTALDGGNGEVDIQYDALEQIDPRTDGYELLAVGDLFPDSKLRHNHQGSSLHSVQYRDLGIILENEASKTSTTSHQEYIGVTDQTLLTESNFEVNDIDYAFGHTPRSTRRYGIIRLVEATFDWHFNPVKLEDLKEVDDIPLVPYFDYVMFNDPTVLTSTETITLTGTSDVNVTGNTVTETDGDMFYSKDMLGLNPSSSLSRLGSAGASNGYIATKKSAAWGSADSGNSVYRTDGVNTFDDLMRLDGKEDSGTIHLYGTVPFKLYRTAAHSIDGVNTRTANYKPERMDGTKDIRFTNVWLTRERTHTTKFEFGNLSKSGNAYDAPNVILPLISQERDLEYGGGSANADIDRTCSLYHPPSRWLGYNVDYNVSYLHMSRVINALQELVRGDADTNLTGSLKPKYGLGISSGYSGDFGHPYDGCLGVFKNLKLGMTETDESELFKLPTTMTSTHSHTSAPLSLDSGYSTYIDSLGTEATTDQHTRTTMIQPYSGDVRVAMGGTRTDAKLLEGLEDYAVSTNKTETHQELNNAQKEGLVASAQMLLKPIFDLNNVDSSSYTSTTNHTTLVFNLDQGSKHIWLSFLPNLTNYYLVSEKGTQADSSANFNSANDVNLRNSKNPIIPSNIVKIISHTVSQAPTTSAFEQHTIVVDGQMLSASGCPFYRLMKIDEVTFNEHRDYIEFNVMKPVKRAVNFKTGESDGDTDFHYQESAYQMHLLLDIDSTITADTDNSLERRVASQTIIGFTHGERLEMNFTDGENSTTKMVTVSIKRPVLGDPSAGFVTSPTVATESSLTLKFGGTLNGNGVVSCAEVIEMRLGRQSKLQRPTTCHIGTTYTIGAQVKREVENIVRTVGLDYDATKSFVTPTGNIVASSTSTSVTCQSNVQGISNDDILYTHTGHLLGKVTNVSNAVITLAKRYYTPSQYDEIVFWDNDTFVSALKFDNTNVYSTLNALLVKKGMDYDVKNGKVTVRDIEDTKHLRVASLSYAESDKLLSVSTNTSLFDKANRIVLIGDRVTHTVERPTKGETREVRVVDSTIKTKTEAETRANELLMLHSDDLRKISINIQKEGLELIEAGDLLRLKFPNHNIPANDYIVFEIENVLAGTLQMTVGTFDKTIAERLSEINMSQGDVSTSLFKRNTVEVSGGTFVFDDMNINVVGVSYEIVGSSNVLSYNSNMGFDDLVGFTEEVGFEHSLVTKKSYGSKFFEQDEYGGLRQ